LSARPDDSIDKLQTAAWRDATEEDEGCLLLAPATEDKSEIQEAYGVVTQHLGSGNPVTALICLNDELALAASSACQDCGFAVPEKMSIIAAGDSPAMEFVRPAITCIDVDLLKHVQTGLNLLEKRINGPLDETDLIHIIEPRLVLRQSVAKA
jgi:LacI family transcriptional regulator